MSQAAQTVYGKTRVRPGESLGQGPTAGPAGQVGSGTETVENIMAMADTIWGRVRQSGIAPADKKGTEKLAQELHAKYKDFATTYPIVFRWMLHTREYERRVFRDFITRHTRTMYETRAKFLEAQAQYLVMLYRKRNPRAGASRLKNYRAMITKNLKDDDKQFQEAVKESEGIVRQIAANNAERRRNCLLAWARRQKPAAADTR